MKEFEEEVEDFEISVKKDKLNDQVEAYIDGRISDLLMGLAIIIGSLVADVRIPKEDIKLIVETSLSENFSKLLNDGIDNKAIKMKKNKKRKE